MAEEMRYNGERLTMEVHSMDEKVKALLQSQLWSVATYGDGAPNVVPVGFRDVMDDGRLVIGDVFMETTVKNVQANGQIAVSAYNAETSEGYQVKGTAEYVTEGPVMDTLRAKAAELFHGALAVKGALLITPETVVVTTPGPDNKKTL